MEKYPSLIILREGDQIDELEQQLNTALTWRLPKKLLAKPLPCAIDLVLIPYHGKREAGDTVRRGRAKSGTTHFHCYATLFTVKYKGKTISSHHPAENPRQTRRHTSTLERSKKLHHDLYSPKHTVPDRYILRSGGL